MPDSNEDAFVLQLLMDAAVARRRTAVATLNAYAANALPKPATDEDLKFWQDELESVEDEIVRLNRGEY
jgi:hypothetical protein